MKLTSNFTILFSSIFLINWFMFDLEVQSNLCATATHHILSMLVGEQVENGWKVEYDGGIWASENTGLTVQLALILCGLFICNFTYMQSRNGIFSGTYPLIYSHPWSFYMWIHYMGTNFWSPYLSHITMSTCTWIESLLVYIFCESK